MTVSPQWIPREQWDALVRGDGCPVCADIASNESVNEHGFTIADLAFSRLRLAANQYVAGYCILLCYQHVREPYELNDRDCTLFLEDMMRAGRAIERVFNPLKMNFNILGNVVPHVHAHILPRYYGDPAPHHPIDPNAAQVLLDPGAYRERVELIRSALS
jgi:diadenosine tetraphosphate (Ap4A) HIT family hydrolase